MNHSLINSLFSFRLFCDEWKLKCEYWQKYFRLFRALFSWIIENDHNMYGSFYCIPMLSIRIISRFKFVQEHTQFKPRLVCDHNENNSCQFVYSHTKKIERKIRLLSGHSEESGWINWIVFVCKPINSNIAYWIIQFDLVLQIHTKYSIRFVVKKKILR